MFRQVSSCVRRLFSNKFASGASSLVSGCSQSAGGGKPRTGSVSRKARHRQNSVDAGRFSEIQTLENRDLPGDALFSAISHGLGAAFNLGGGTQTERQSATTSRSRRNAEGDFDMMLSGFGSFARRRDDVGDISIANDDYSNFKPTSRNPSTSGGFADAAIGSSAGGQASQQFALTFGNAFSMNAAIAPSLSDPMGTDQYQPLIATANALSSSPAAAPQASEPGAPATGEISNFKSQISDLKSEFSNSTSPSTSQSTNPLRSNPNIALAAAGAAMHTNSRNLDANPASRNHLPRPQTTGANVDLDALFGTGDQQPTTGGDGVGSRHLATPTNIYVVDWNTGMTLEEGHSFPVLVNQPMDLRAQIYGKAVASSSPYSWSTSSANVSYSAGSTTYRLQFRFGSTFGGGAADRTDHITLTINFADSSTQNITYDFHVVNNTWDAGTTNFSATRGNVQTPDLPQSSQSWIAGDDYAFSANTGQLTTAHFLPEYQPGLPSFGLFYNSELASPKPIFTDHVGVPSSLTTKVTAQLTLDSTTYSKYYYDRASLNTGALVQTAAIGDASALSSGRYEFTLTDTAVPSSGTTITNNNAGGVDILNYSSSPIGKGWGIAGLTRLYSYATPEEDPWPPYMFGVMLDNGDGTSLWFQQVSGVFVSPAGDFSSLVMNMDDSFTRTMLDGTVVEYDDDGYQTSIVDRIGNQYDFTYDTGKLTHITDPNGADTEFTYSSGKLVTVEDPAGRVMTVTHDGSKLDSITDADGSEWGFEYDSDGRMTSRTDPRDNTTEFAWDTFAKLDGITRADTTEIALDPFVERGLLASGTGTSGSPATAVLLAGAHATYTDGRDNDWQYRFDWRGFGHATEQSDPLDHLSTAHFDTNGLAIASTDELDRVGFYRRDSDGNVTKQIKADYTQWNFTFNAYGQVLTAPNETNHTTTFDYDDGESGEGNTGELLSITNALSEEMTFTYRTDGILESVTDFGGRETTYVLDMDTDIDLPSGITYADSSAVAFAYNAAGQITEFTDENDNVTTFGVNADNNRVESITLPDLTPGNLTDATSAYLFGYDERGNRHTVTLPDDTPLTGADNPVWTFDFDELNRPTDTTDPLTHVTHLGYDEEGNNTSFTNALTKTWTFSFDEANRMFETETPEEQVTHYTLDAAGQVSMLTDPALYETTYTYTNLGDVKTETDPTGTVWTYSFDTDNGLQTGDGLGSTTVYDDIGRVHTYTDPRGKTTTYDYDPGAYEVIVTDPSSQDWTYNYDDRHHLETVLTPEGITTTYGYDPVGNMTSILNVVGMDDIETQYQFDPQNHVSKIIDAEAGETDFTYDVQGRMTSLTDPVENVTSWQYDTAGRVITEVDPFTNETHYDYDDAGQLTWIEDRLDRVRTFAYDDAGRRTDEYWFTNSTDALDDPPSLATYHAHTDFDADNRVESATDDFSQYNYTYSVGSGTWTTAEDNTGTPDMPAIEFTRTFDARMRETGLEDNYGTVRTYGYDNADNLTFAQLDVDGASIQPTILLAYDDNGMLYTITRQTATEAPTGIDPPPWIQVKTTIDHDHDNRVTDILHQKYVNGSPSTTINEYEYQWDTANRLTDETSVDGAKEFGYDLTGQLTDVTLDTVLVEEFGYDANGNRNTTGYVVDTGNQISEDPTYIYTYDTEGNQLTKTSKAIDGHTWTNSWDTRNRLTSVVETDDEDHVVATSTYTYDIYDRRIAVEVDPDGAGGGASQKLWTAWDNGNVWADLTGDEVSAEVVTNYLTGTALDQLFAKVTEADAVDYYMTDLIGSVRDIANAANGNAVDHITYSAFGKVQTESAEPETDITDPNPHQGDRFKFAARELDKSSGEYNLRARYYSPETGHFLSKDPIDLVAGDQNLGRYSKNNPVTGRDPTGLWDVFSDGVITLRQLLDDIDCVMTGIGEDASMNDLLSGLADHFDPRVPGRNVFLPVSIGGYENFIDVGHFFFSAWLAQKAGSAFSSWAGIGVEVFQAVTEPFRYGCWIWPSAFSGEDVFSDFLGNMFSDLLDTHRRGRPSDTILETLDFFSQFWSDPGNLDRVGKLPHRNENDLNRDVQNQVQQEKDTLSEHRWRTASNPNYFIGPKY